ncbi:MAG: hypothetical protein KGD59_08635 [Candidatus Heimdallarchaeota archaeon]|nr:hypothetical protein [Candidatus Heimdallarchaeota archaeon]MBY8994602.1 hypothetical protein [Candidatus Heimdallarchaeota archaeon]
MSARVPLKDIVLNCKGCNKDINIPIYVDDLKTQVGGLWQVSFLHDDHVITLLLDKNLALRQHRSSTIARTSREEVSARTSASATAQAASTAAAATATPSPRAEARASITLMLKTFGNNLEYVMKPCMTGETVVVVGDLALMEIAIATLKMFVHKKELRICWYTETFVDPRDYDIIGIAPGLQDYYESEVTLDIDQKKVVNGEECDYCRKVLKGLDKMNETKAANELKDRIKNVYRSLLWMHQI